MAGRSGIDDIDRRLLELLFADGRLSINELAAVVNVSRANAYQRLDRLRAEGVLTGFTAIVDEAKLGLPIIVLILINAGVYLIARANPIFAEPNSSPSRAACKSDRISSAVAVSSLTPTSKRGGRSG